MLDRHVFEDQCRDDGSRCYSAAYLNADGALVVKIHDQGPVVQRALGASEYESTETFTVDQTARLREELGDDLIAAIAQRFPDSAQFAKHVATLGVGRGKVWNRIGD
ncbi:hypothetical protein [Mycobacterium sp. OTB74]|jgi:hypothetical protein|uniref:hypothetical protein n=1 Tax=Mycobacterium sp. OTB74 TaxID=1853452 RepID=UPI0024752586|nr:hypothetical protein [Mycobacterium sp. OTB74]MDH6245509.1 hypothetical protein [Mycobacterium sp. OTB74]